MKRKEREASSGEPLVPRSLAPKWRRNRQRRAFALCRRPGAILAAVLVFCAAPAAAQSLSTSTFPWAGTDRTVITYAPTRPAVNPALVVVLHGGGGDAASAIDHGDGRWNDAAETNGFYVVYPEGVAYADNPDRHSWNDCRAPSTDPGDGGHANDRRISTADDVGFILALIERMAADRGIDRSRVYVGGASNGGMMTLRLAREAPAMFAGFGPVIAALPVKDECADPDLATLQTGGRTMIFLYGDADEFVPPEGGCVADPIFRECDQGNVISADATIARLADWFGVDAMAPEVAQPNPVIFDFSRQHWQDFSRDGSVILRVVRVEGGGHNQPGDEQYNLLTRALGIGWRNLDINHVRTMAQFFGLCTVDPDCY